MPYCWSPGCLLSGLLWLTTLSKCAARPAYAEPPRDWLGTLRPVTLFILDEGHTPRRPGRKVRHRFANNKGYTRNRIALRARSVSIGDAT
jgi:hypothetical protein